MNRTVAVALSAAFIAVALPVSPLSPIVTTAAHATTKTTTGTASYYGKRFQGRRTANGERFDMNKMTAAHRSLPFGTKVKITNPRNGRSVVVRINDRGPYIHGRSIDLSRGAAARIGMVNQGVARVKMEIL